MGRRHIYAYDFIRAIAIIMVVAVHCIPGRAETSAAHFYNTLFQAALFPCNVLFFILSGLLNIHADYESHYLDYALRKLRSILLPTLVFMFINTVVDMVGLPGADFVTIAKQFLTNSFSSYSDSIFLVRHGNLCHDSCSAFLCKFV
ncbi:acyltransferase family protein [Parafannyhessea umbonata]|uniref:acyltransferase family protein n=1 Tax=Parafannyhessea umbonata TaxID=604330 RepID=UPI0034C5C979